MAAGLGFKTFNTGDVLTAADVNGYLMQGVLVFASAAARDAAITSPQEGQIAYLKDTNGTTYYTGSAWSPLVPTSFGKVLQVVYGSTTTQTVSTSATYADTTLSASITPSATSSKVLVLVSQSMAVERNAPTGGYARIQLVRGSTSVLDTGSRTTGFEMYTPSGVTYMRQQGLTPVNYLDSPSTTSATTYKTQLACFGSAPAGFSSIAQQDNVVSTIMLLEIGA